MAHDVVVRGGEVIDGTGADPFVADIAIDGNTIVEVGSVTATGAEEIDAAGLTVTPGFVDIHTHLDAQIGWDPYLTPVSWHGVTTALLGNCGVTFAPCKPSDRELLAGMMETVEDIPKDAILNGLSWEWEGYGGYLDELEALNPAINVAGLVGHCAVRFYVMGDRGVADVATPEEQAEIARIVGESVRDGAVGFSTSRFLGHYLPDGRHVPGTHAPHEELVAIAEAVGEHGGLMQNVMNFAGDFAGELELLAKEAKAAGRVLFSNGAGPTTRFSDGVTEAIDRYRAEGLDINAVSIPRGSGFVAGLQANFLWRGGKWGELYRMPVAERLGAIQDEAFRNQLIKEANEQEQRFDFNQVFWLGPDDVPNYVAGREWSLPVLAAEAGETPAETFLRMALESDGTALYVIRFFNQNLDVLEQVITNDFTVPGLGDAGAHVSQIMDAGWATFVMSHWMRDRGLYSPAEAVRRITSVPARIIGLQDRGTLQPGKRADVNVMDIPNLGELQPRMVNDFPGGAPRFVQRARGYKATLCNGKVVLRDDELTGERAGRVLRHGA